MIPKLVINSLPYHEGFPGINSKILSFQRKSMCFFTQDNIDIFYPNLSKLIQISLQAINYLHHF